MLREKKTSKGKQRIELQKIQDKDALYISFSKRRNGVFAKASDISTLCGTDLAVLIFSPTGRPHSFGSPAVNPVVDRFLSGGLLPSSSGSHAEQAYRRKLVQNLNREATELTRRVEAGKAKKTELEERLSAAAQGLEWLQDLDGLGSRELDLLEESLHLLKIRAEARARELLTAAGASSAVHPSSSSNPVQPADPIRMLDHYEPAPRQPNPPPVEGVEFADVSAWFV